MLYAVFAVNVGAHPMTHNWAPAAPNVASSAKRKPGNDPNRPKRPTSAYFYFVQLEREEAAKRGEKITRVCIILLFQSFQISLASRNSVLMVWYGIVVFNIPLDTL